MHLLVRCLLQTHPQLHKLLKKHYKPNFNASMLARVWLRQSRVDLEAMRILRDHSREFSCIAFHAHQSVEKALKAAVLEVSGLCDRNHWLVPKAVVIRVVRPELKPFFLLPSLRVLEPLYLKCRYPDQYNPPIAPTDVINETIATQAADTAENVMKVVTESIISQWQQKHYISK